MDWSAVQTFKDVIELAADKYGSKVAFRDQRRDLTFSEYAAEVDRIALWLCRSGLQKGDRIAILSQNRVEVPVLLGLAKAGYIPVPLNWRLPVEDVLGLLTDCEPAALFIESRYLPAFTHLDDRLPPILTIVIDADSGERPTYDSVVAEVPAGGVALVSPDDPCSIIYTSGTTGKPKGVVLSHRGVVGNCRDIAREAIGFEENDVSLMVMPLFHVGGIWYYLFPSFASGCTTVIREKFEPEDVISHLKSEAITNIHLVPTMLADLLNRPGFVDAASTLRLIVYAGSSMPGDLLRRAMGALARCRFTQAYGSTEAGSITTLGPKFHEQALLDPASEGLLKSCGLPIGDTQIRIEQRDPVTDLAVGEILVHSSKLMKEYWRLPEATSDRVENGWLRTGDIGFIDSNGFLYIVDRKNDMIISGGENVFPFEVEEALRLDSRVLDVAVFGVPDPRWVEMIVAAVVLRPGVCATPEEIIERARGYLPGYKTPKRVVLVENLPKNAVGKVLRKQLRAEYAAIGSL